MKAIFTVKRLDFKTINELPNSWSDQDYKILLEIMDYGDSTDLPPEELKEMCLMSLTDYEPEDAAKIVLEYLFKDRLSKGQIENLSNEILEEKLWEEYADLSQHEDFFNGNQLLYEAFDGKFPIPEALKLQVSVTVAHEGGLAIFKNFPKAPLIRLLVAGMPENTLIFRLFEEQVAGDIFEDAEHIIWQLKAEPIDGQTAIYDIISSNYWFHDFRYIDSFEADTHADEISPTAS